MERFDIIHQIPKPVDCLLCLWVLNHLPENHAERALANLRASGSKYLIYTYWSGMADSLDIGSIEAVSVKPYVDSELRLVKC